jgi:hypothetical protein
LHYRSVPWPCRIQTFVLPVCSLQTLFPNICIIGPFPGHSASKHLYYRSARNGCCFLTFACITGLFPGHAVSKHLHYRSVCYGRCFLKFVLSVHSLAILHPNICIAGLLVTDVVS